MVVSRRVVEEMRWWREMLFMLLWRFDVEERRTVWVIASGDVVLLALDADVRGDDAVGRVGFCVEDGVREGSCGCVEEVV